MEKLDVLFLIFGSEAQEDYITDNIKEGLEDNGKSFECIKIENYNSTFSNEKFISLAENSTWIFIIIYPGYFPPEPNSLDNSNLSMFDFEKFWDKCVYFDATEWRFDHKACWGKGLRNEPFNFTYMKEKCKAYFKRECYIQDFKEGYWPFPYSFSVEKRGIFTGIDNDFKKIYHVFCSFPQSFTGLRRECIEFCNFLSNYPMLNIKIATGLERGEYIKTVAESMITLDSAGAGQCNTRFFEITPNFTVVFRQQYDVVIPYDFDHSGQKGKEMIVEYSDYKDMKIKILNYLKDVDNLIDMACASREHSLKYHTCKARVKYIFDILENKLPSDAFSENPLIK